MSKDKFLEAVHRCNNYNPLGENKDVIKNIYEIKRPRDFEKLKLSDERCDELLVSIETLVDQERAIQDIPKVFFEVKPKPSKIANFI